MAILFLDANVLFSAAYNETNGLRRLWQLPKIQLISSQYAAEEARRNLQPAQQARLKLLLNQIDLVAATHNEGLIPHHIKLAAKDRPILSAAIAAQANFLITGDFKDFGPFYGKIIAGVTILPPAEYFKRTKC